MSARSAILPALLAAFALPAVAQVPSCGGIGVVGEWAGGDAEGSDLAALAAPLEGAGDVPIAGHLVRLFRLSEPTELRADVEATDGGDPYASIFSADGREVATDDDGGGALAARIRADLDAGDYCLAARSYEAGVTPVALRLGPAASFTDDAPDAPPAPRAPAAADLLPPPPDVEATGACGSGDELTIAEAALDAAALDRGVEVTAIAETHPGLAFALAKPARVTITARGDLADPRISLLDAGGAVLAENDDAGGLDSRIDTARPLPEGEYCIALDDLNASAEPIAVALRRFDPAADRAARIGTLALAPAASDDVAVTELGVLDSALTASMEAGPAARWFAFDLEAGGLLVVEAVAVDGEADPVVSLFDRVGREVAANDDGPSGLDSFLVHRALPGRYLLGVRTYDDGPGEVRILAERYVPAR